MVKDLSFITHLYCAVLTSVEPRGSKATDLRKTLLQRFDYKVTNVSFYLLLQRMNSRKLIKMGADETDGRYVIHPTNRGLIEVRRAIEFYESLKDSLGNRPSS